MSEKKKIETKAKKLWGRDLHYNQAAPPHCYQLKNIFNVKWKKFFIGNLLEIGCGSGSDLNIFSKNKKINKITAIDLGDNITKLSKKYIKNKNIRIEKGNALSLNYKNNQFDVVYSFGVFHHTSDPYACIKEARRVLKKNGYLFTYLYADHEDIFIKRIGIFFEKILMSIFKLLPYRFQNLICKILSPICWIVFSVPSIIFRLFGLNKFSQKFPFYFASHPFSLTNNLKDRLMSPINYRFSKSEIERILTKLKFAEFQVVKNASGIYICSKK